MMSRLIRRNSVKVNCPIINCMEQTIKSNKLFSQQIQQWRNIQIKYMGELMGLQQKIRDRIQQIFSKTNQQFLKMLQIVLKSHKIMITKMNHQIFQANFLLFQNIIQSQKAIIISQKNQLRYIKQKKGQLIKFHQQQTKVKKSLADELIQEIFTHNSFNNESNRNKIASKAQKLSQKNQSQLLKFQQAKAQYNQKLCKYKQNLLQFEKYQMQFAEQNFKVINKASYSISVFAESLLEQIQYFSQYVKQKTNRDFDNSVVSLFQCQYESILNLSYKGYTETTIELIRSRTLDQIIQYTKNKQIKQKIKNLTLSTQINPQFTDQTTRQVQLIKKIIKSKQKNLVEQLKIILSKNYKLRMNAVFMLQLYRINGQFQIDKDRIEPIVCLINVLLKISHIHKDVFVIKQIIILLLTYYTTLKIDDNETKVYILQFFKQSKFWKDFELWESMLIQSIYIQKKTTINMLLTTSCLTNKNQLADAEKTLILNQILYFVRNMILFDFTQKQVKQFVNKFIKLLKQDDKFLQDIYKSKDDALKEQQKAKQSQIIKPDNQLFKCIVLEQI